MRLVAVQCVPYRLRFARPLRTAAGLFVQREGTVVSLSADTGLTGCGDAAPWPGFGGGEAAVRTDLTTLRTRLNGARLGAVADIAPLIANLAPEVAHAVELACLDLLAQAQDVPLCRLLSAEQPLLRVPVHALVSDAVQASMAVRDGARAVKIKVGTLALGDEGVRLGALRAAIGSHVGLRLDANGAWPVATAKSAMRMLAAYTPEWLEQPVAHVEGLAEVRSAATGMAIAADESVQTMAQLDAVIAAGAADVIVIKPMFAGGLLAAAALHARAHAAGLRTVITHALESSVGRTGALHLAAAVAPGTPHGLGNPLATDVAEGPVIANYVAHVPRQPGLGVRPVWPASAPAAATASTASGVPPC